MAICLSSTIMMSLRRTCTKSVKPRFLGTILRNACTPKNSKHYFVNWIYESQMERLMEKTRFGKCCRSAAIRYLNPRKTVKIMVSITGSYRRRVPFLIMWIEIVENGTQL